MSGLFGYTNAKQPSALKGMRAQTSVYGTVIPIVYGRTRVPGNLLWYGDFKAFKVKAQGGKGGLFGGGGKGGGGYTYQASVEIGICEGPIRGVRNIFDSAGVLAVNQAVETYTVPGGGGSYTVTHSANFFGNLGVTRGDTYSVAVNDYGNPAGPQTLTGTQQTPMVLVVSSPGAGQYMESAGVYTFSAADAGKVMTITYDWTPPNSTDNGQPLTIAQFAQFLGTQGQAPWSYLTTNHPSQALGYTALAYLAAASLNLGASGSMGNYSYEVDALLPFGAGIPDANPRDVVIDLLTNSLYGAGFPLNEIGDLSNYSAFCIANGLFISPVLDSDQPANQWIDSILQGTNSEAFMSQGFLRIAPYGDTSAVGNGATYIANTQPIYDLNDDDFLDRGGKDPVTITRPTIADVFNNVKVEYLDRSNNYNPVVVEEFDQNSIETYRKRQVSPTQMHFFTTQGAAQQAANMLLKRQVYVRNTYDFALDRRYVLLDPMDLVTLTDANLGLSKRPVRIKEIQEQQDGSLAIVAEDFPWGTATPTLYPKQTTSPFIPSADADPGSVNPPILFEALSRLNGQIGYEVWMGLSGSSPNWGGCHVWVSTDGITYKQVLDAEGNTAMFTPSRMGVLTTSLASHSDPDTTDSFGVDLSQSFGQLFSGSASDCDNFRTLCWVDGELISYQTATLGAIYNYTLGTRLRRGVFGSPIGAHTIGSKFLRLDENIFAWQYDPTLIGTTVHFKFTSFNLVGAREQSLAGVTDYTLTLTGTGPGLLTPAHATYRPLLDPLTGHDAGSSATINVAAFSMRVSGMPDIAVNSGAVTGLSYDTLYYVYYDDPSFLGGTVTYHATGTKETALNGAGRFFVGSITTPVAGGVDTVGNDDGGSGAQSGMVTVLPMSVATVSTIGNGSVANPNNAIDGDQSTYASLTVSGDGNQNVAQLTLSAPAGVLRRPITVNVMVILEFVSNSLSPQGLVNNLLVTALPTSNTLLASNGPVAITKLGAGLPVSTSPARIGIQILLGTQWRVLPSGFATSGSAEVRVHEAWVEVRE